MDTARCGSASPPREGNEVEGVRRLGALVFRAGAISNFIVTVPAFVIYDFYVHSFFPNPPNYPFLILIWSGMAFLWGIMFLEISFDVIGRYRMIKYTWLEKCVTSGCVTFGFVTHNVPLGAMLGVTVTDVIWIPLFVLVHVRVARLLHSGSGATQGSA
jgi:hypothetical protein